MLAPDTIRKDTLQSLGIEDLPEETQNEILTIATASILQSVTAAVLTRMPDEVQNQFMDAFGMGRGEEAEQLLRAHIPDADTFVAEEIRKATEEFKTLYTQGK